MAVIKNGKTGEALPGATLLLQGTIKLQLPIQVTPLYLDHGSHNDPSDIDLTAILEFNRFTLNPRLWVYLNDRTTLNVGDNSTIENRIGGDLNYIKGK
ncbi:hypothetical protein KHS38_21935 [Mucilaginibacter sp. Bleaf8]|uniref:hypothetical protein n=1 Tax=Mucilaginibacter sp. Bleaf8 TaxID=2834430 RepID=UPI001BD02C83|nr:hypothetical protein [Mucilaginibacter sp. Bleaf8]MBS7567081.1 hypothetical protein [Mucilaginibacter sp. Bleaf8]